MRWTCALGCGDLDAGHLEELSEHARLMHPDLDGAAEYWPDGSVVVHETLEPVEFGQVADG